MPPDPIEYRIVRNLQAALEQIAVVNGYHYDVAASAVKLDPNNDVETLIAPDGPRPFIVLEVLPEDWDYGAVSHGDIRMGFPVRIHWVSDSSPTSDADRMHTYFKGCADVEQALAVDTGRGGLAVDTRITKRTFDTLVDGTQVWAVLETSIRIYRTYGRPNG